MTLQSDANSPRARRAKAAALKRGDQFKSRVTLGRDVLPNVDGRSAVARRYRDISAAILSDQGGESVCSETRQQLIRRFSAAAVIAEQMEAALANGKDIDVPAHCQLTSTMVRVAHRIGVDRIPKDITDDALTAALREEYGYGHD
jgi:hypothetical protein